LARFDGEVIEHPPGPALPVNDPPHDQPRLGSEEILAPDRREHALQAVAPDS